MHDYDLDKDIEAILEELGVGEEEHAPAIDRFGAHLQGYFQYQFDSTLAGMDDDMTLGEAREQSRQRAFAEVGAIAMMIALAHPEWAAAHIASLTGDADCLGENADSMFGCLSEADG